MGRGEGSLGAVEGAVGRARCLRALACKATPAARCEGRRPSLVIAMPSHHGTRWHALATISDRPVMSEITTAGHQRLPSWGEAKGG